MDTPHPELSRRRFLLNAAAAFAAPSVAGIPGANAAEPGRTGLIDTHVYLGRWPIRHHRLAEPGLLAAKLGAHGVTEAWTGSLDGLLHKDLRSVNDRLVEACAQHPIFRPVGALNPALPRWEDDLERCSVRHGMRGVRLHPGHHGYPLDDPRFVELLRLAASRRLFVQIVCAMEDERTQHPLLRVPPLDLSPLAPALEKAPGARVMLLNWPRLVARRPAAAAFKAMPLLFDIAMLEGAAGIEALLREMPLERLCFGSYAPVFYFESAELKLRESVLDDRQLAAIARENAARWLQG